MGRVSDPIVKDGDSIAVWFSCGAASAVAAKKTLERYGDTCEIRILNNPIREEHPDNQRFLRDVEAWLDHPIETVVNSKYPNASCVEVWEHRKFMGGHAGAPCTLMLKKRARQEWERNNPCDWLVLGFTSEEQGRHDRFVLAERDTLLPILIDAELTKRDCFQIITDAGIRLPAIYDHGMPNANCIGCVKATSPTYWNLVRREFPEAFNERSEQSRRLGARLVRVKGERIFLDELDPEAKGRSLDSYRIECGIFCDLEQAFDEPSETVKTVNDFSRWFA